MSRRAPQEGTIRQRADGRWEAVVHLGYEGGKRRRKSLYGKTQREVQQKLVVAQRNLQLGLVPTDDRLTIAQFLDRWLEDVVRMTVRPRTFNSYSQIVRLHLNPELGRTPLSRLSPQQVQTLLNAKYASGLSARSVGIIHAVLRQALNQALRWGYVHRNVATLVRPPTAPRLEILPLSPEQARALLESVKGDRLEALYSVAIALGLRLGEILGLRWSDVDLEAGTIRVAQALQRVDGKLDFAEPKSQRSRRTISLPASVARALRAHRAHQLEERLFVGAGWNEFDLVFVSSVGTPLDARNVTRRFQLALDHAGLPHLRFHDLRHTCASLLLAQGVSARVVMETLGHSQISLTLNTYSHVMPSLQREAADQMEAVLTSPRSSTST